MSVSIERRRLVMGLGALVLPIGRSLYAQVAEAKGFTDPGVKATPILQWLSDDFGLGRGHGMALVHVFRNGAQIGDKHVNTGGTHSDPSNRLELDGVAARR